MPLKLESWNKPLKPDHQVIQCALKLAMMTSKLILKIGTLVWTHLRDASVNNDT